MTRLFSLLLAAGLFVLLVNPWPGVDAAGCNGQLVTASWYGPGFHGRKTASGERFDQNAMTAAHKTLPFGTRVRVVDQRTGKSVRVRINDRGPFVKGRALDLSRGAAKAIGLIEPGHARVCMEVQPQHDRL